MISIKILALDSTPRNRKLIPELKEALKGMNYVIDIVPGVDGRKVNAAANDLINQDLNRIVLGRATTSSEAACSLGHHEMQRSTESSWTLALEDDAEILEPLLLKSCLESIERLDYRRPVIISLFKGLRGVRWFGKQKSPFSTFAQRLYRPSTHAVAYLINSDLGLLARNQTQLVGSPDWPTWIYKCAFFESTVPIFGSLPKSESVISQTMPIAYTTTVSREEGSRFWGILGLFRSDLIKAYSGRSTYFKFVFAWYLFTRFKFLTSNDFRKQILQRT
jgi:hypothetical protein